MLHQGKSSLLSSDKKKLFMILVLLQLVVLELLTVIAVTKYDGVRAGKGDAGDDWRKCGHISLDSDIRN